MGKRLTQEERNEREAKRRAEKQARRDARHAASVLRRHRGLITKRGWERRHRECPCANHDPDVCKGRLALNVPICACVCHRTTESLPDPNVGYEKMREAR